MIDRLDELLCVLATIVGLVLIVLVLIVAMADAASTNWVSALQARFNTYPGQVVPADPRFPNMPRFRYVGTTVSGVDYYVHFKQLN